MWVLVFVETAVGARVYLPRSLPPRCGVGSLFVSNLHGLMNRIKHLAGHLNAPPKGTVSHFVGVKWAEGADQEKKQKMLQELREFPVTIPE